MFLLIVIALHPSLLFAIEAGSLHLERSTIEFVELCSLWRVVWHFCQWHLCELLIRVIIIMVQLVSTELRTLLIGFHNLELLDFYRCASQRICLKIWFPVNSWSSLSHPLSNSKIETFLCKKTFLADFLSFIDNYVKQQITTIKSADYFGTVSPIDGQFVK